MISGSYANLPIYYLRIWLIAVSVILQKICRIRKRGKISGAKLLVNLLKENLYHWFKIRYAKLLAICFMFLNIIFQLTVVRQFIADKLFHFNTILFDGINKQPGEITYLRGFAFTIPDLQVFKDHLMIFQTVFSFVMWDWYFTIDAGKV